MTYSGSNNSYFRQLPELDYPSLANDRKSAYDYQIVKNIFKRAVLRDDIFNDVMGGNRMGFSTFLVKTGKFRENIFRKSKIRPDYCIESIQKLKDFI